MKKIAIFGAGGFGKEVATIINKINEKKPVWNFIGFFDDGILPGVKISKYGVVIGGLNELNQVNYSLSVVFAIGQPEILKLLVSRITNSFLDFPNIVHPDVYFADFESLKIGRGNIIVRGCSFSCDVEIGEFNQFNSISALAHDVEVGSFNVFMPLTRISGEVQIGNGNLFSINSIVLQTIAVGDNKRIGPNSVLMTKPRKEGLYMGNPARLTKL